MPRALWWPKGGGAVSHEPGTPVDERECQSRIGTHVGFKSLHAGRVQDRVLNFIRTSVYDKYSGSTKIATQLDHISHCKETSGINWSNR